MTRADASTFICGVVEGFYGRPWTIEQRKRLFARMKEFGMNTYLYAPKDDSKHRLYWRDLYLVEEAEALRELIDACAECNINFVYAISPGLDITYSSQKEQAILKRTSALVAFLTSIRTGSGGFIGSTWSVQWLWADQWPILALLSLFDPMFVWSSTDGLFRTIVDIKWTDEVNSHCILFEVVS